LFNKYSSVHVGAAKQPSVDSQKSAATPVGHGLLSKHRTKMSA